MSNGQNVSGVLPMWNAWMQQGPAQYAPFNTIAGFTPMQQQAWGAGMQGAGNIAQGGQGMMGSYANYLQQPGQFNPSMNWFNNPHMASAVQGAVNPMIQNFERQTMPGINSAFSSQPGSSRQGIAQGLALSDLNQQIGDVSSGMYNQMYQQGQNAYLQDMATQLQARQGAYQMMPGIFDMYSQSQMQPYSIMGEIGGMQQGMNQAQIDAMRDRWDFEQNAVGNKLGQAISMLTGTGAGSYGRSSGSAGKF